MNCEHFEQLIEQEQTASTVEQQQLAQHLQACTACSAVAAKHQQYKTVLAGFSTPPLNRARAARMIRLADAQAQQSASLLSRPFTQGFAAAALMAVALTVGINGFENPIDIESTEVLVAEYDWTQEVTIAITVPQDMVAAQLVLQLPADMSIEGYEYLSEVVWPIDLKEGRNTIVLPVLIDQMAQFSEQLSVPASLIYDNKQKDFELELLLGAQALQQSSHGQLPKGAALKTLA